MAAKASPYGRRLIVFIIVIGAMYGLVALTADWKPKLGLDLQGGTRITLQAKTPDGGDAPADQLEEARTIIDQRVNGSGVTESEVSTQGGQNIVVEVPGEPRPDLADTVGRSAQLYFRLVADVPVQYMVPPGTELPPAEGEGEGDGTGKKGKKKDAEPQGRAVSDGLLAADETTSPTSTPTSTATPTPTPTPTPTATPPADKGANITDYLAWQANPGTEWLEAYQRYTCPEEGSAANVVDDPDKPLVACDEDGNKYLLTVAVIRGEQLDDANFGTPQGGIGWVVTLDFDGSASGTFADVTGAINQQFNSNGSPKTFAIVLDGVVLSTPSVSQGAITGGKAEISGDFTQESSQSLATSLKYGALPLKFDIAETSIEGPTLAGDQLRGGLLAGALGLGLVLIYCLVYYRGLGLVVVASLGLAAAITYALVLLLAEAASFTLTLPGIAGLIVGVGITADSFIVYFERIRDEMREGKSMRVAVESGWVHARNTCLAADAVALLCGTVLYIFAIGAVKGFAFALVLTTIIDLAVFFWFTKPMVSWMARFKFFNGGHSLSGLSAEAVGIERIGSTRTAGGHA
ncbi:MAG TPA: protein translocase subunit SecD [Nocardioidaceae bacterium]|nr:protein translocase subunit SecD [Nocardioidaceae bacterium]